MQIINNIIAKPSTPIVGSVAMYYKTEPLYTDVNRYTHTNNWEILEAIKIITKLGFSLDLIDRNCHNWNPTKKYDIFLGLGVGNAGRNFARYSKISQAPKKVLLAMGPATWDEKVLKRYKMFHDRTGQYAPPMRLQGLTSGQLGEIFDATDFIFNIGEKDTPAYNSFADLDKPVLNFYPSISPKVKFDERWLESREINSFLCFTGNGFICKGVDLVVEAFLKAPDKELHICGPASEKAFFEHYGNVINNSPNIKYHGFIEPGGARFNELAAKCSFVVFHSAAEGCCTSVATAIKAGLIPIINEWTGINIVDEGYILSEEGDLIKNIVEAVDTASNITKKEYEKLVSKILNKATIFSQDSFIKSYTKAISYVIQN